MTERDPDLWPHILSKLAAHDALTADEAAAAMQEVMAGEATPAQLGGLLMALRTKGETVDEVDGLARTMLAFANPVTPPAPVIDTCGTGGDRTGTFNISTIAAIVVAGAGVPPCDGSRRTGAPRAPRADGVQLPRSADESRPPVRPGGRRLRRTDAAPHGRGSRSARHASEAVPRCRRHRRAHDHRPVESVRGRRRDRDRTLNRPRRARTVARETGRLEGWGSRRRGGDRPGDSGR